jgi:hypothetical protein
VRPAAIAVLLCAARAAAAPVAIVDDETRWQLDLPDGWETIEVPAPATGKTLAAFAAGARRVVVARVRGNTDGAYDGKPGFYAGLEEGVAQAVPGYARLSGEPKKLGKKGKLPAYDLWYRTGDGVRGVRFIFLHGYTLMATTDLPGQRSVARDARRLIESFGPAR